MSQQPPTYITDWHMAEYMAAEWVRYWGWHDARVTQGGADGGLDVIGRGIAAQVKFKGSQTGAPDIQKLIGAAYRLGSAQLMFFSATSYSKKAVEVAEYSRMALFTYDVLGRMTAVNGVARWVIQRAEAQRAESQRAAQQAQSHAAQKQWLRTQRKPNTVSNRVDAAVLDTLRRWVEEGFNKVRRYRADSTLRKTARLPKSQQPMSPSQHEADRMVAERKWVSIGWASLSVLAYTLAVLLGIGTISGVTGIVLDREVQTVYEYVALVVAILLFLSATVGVGLLGRYAGRRARA